LQPNQDAARAVVDSAQLGQTLSFMRTLLGVGHALEARSKRMQARIGVTASQRLLLRIVGRYPGISAGELAQLMEVHASTVTGVLQRLEQRRWISRRGHPSDRRRALLELTEDGSKIDALRTGTVEAALRRALGRCSEEQIAAALVVLDAVSRELVREE
jgi:DNA-binding MarR family transcriptional regulator